MFDEYKPFLKIILRNWWLLLLTAVTAAIAAFYITAALPAQYRSSTRLIISPNLDVVDGSSDLLRSLDTLDRATIVSTYAEILASAEIRNRAREAMQLPPGALEGYTVNAVRLPEANVLEISVTGDDRGRVQALAEAVANAGIPYIEETYPVYNLSLLEPATAPSSPISPKPERNAAVAFVLGAAVGALLALIRSPSALASARQEAAGARPPALQTAESPTDHNYPKDTDDADSRVRNVPLSQTD